MSYVKLDTKILNSTIWMDADACKLFITALLMAEPFEVTEPLRTIRIDDTEHDDFIVPPGWYGHVPAAGPGIVRQALLEWEAGSAALQRLASPEKTSRTAAFEGRRMVRIDGGYLILNYITYRDRDHTSAERQARFRARKKGKVTLPSRSNGVIVTGVTHADADADEEAESLKAGKGSKDPFPSSSAEATDSLANGSRDLSKAEKQRRFAQAAVDAYNTKLTGEAGKLSAVTILSDARIKQANRCCKLARKFIDANFPDGLSARQFWALYFSEVDRDDFKAGRIPPKPGNGHDKWKPNFDYLTRESVVTQVLDDAMARPADTDVE